jgi:drug/metabolite transporter (DMT)-like permease
MDKKSNINTLATIAGILAILFWASTIAFSKSAMTREGNFNLAFYSFFYSGLLLFLILSIFQKKSSFYSKLKNLPISFYFKIGIFLVLNNVFLFTAIGMARKNEELIIVTLLNYCWPVMIYILRIVIFKVKLPIFFFSTGVLLSLTGMTIALIEANGPIEFAHVFRGGRDIFLAYSFAFLTAFCWALYTNLTAKFKSEDDIAALPVLFLLSSLSFLLIIAIRGELSQLHFSAIAFNPELLYIIIGPTTLAYLFWYLAIKWGNRTLITSLSFFIPILSIAILHFKLRLDVSLYFWLAVFLLISGSYICYRSFGK